MSNVDAHDVLRALGHHDVVRFEDNGYVYLAMNVKGLWYTTADSHNSYVDHVYNTMALAILLEDKTFHVVFSWSRIEDDYDPITDPFPSVLPGEWLAESRLHRPTLKKPAVKPRWRSEPDTIRAQDQKENYGG